MNIRRMKNEDKKIVVDMMREFYSSPAVSTNGSEEIFAVDVKYSIEDNPYLEGYVLEIENKIVGYVMLAKSFSTEFGKSKVGIVLAKNNSVFCSACHHSIRLVCAFCYQIVN